METKYELVGRQSTISFVMPSSLNRKWRAGSSKAELMMGFSMTNCFTDWSPRPAGIVGQRRLLPLIRQLQVDHVYFSDPYVF
jgi:hypothetical protein